MRGHAALLVALVSAPAAAFEPVCRAERGAGDYVEQLTSSICSTDPQCTAGTGFARGAQLGEHTYLTHEAMVLAGLGDFAVSEPLDYYVAGVPAQAMQCAAATTQLRSVEPSGTGQLRRHVKSPTVEAGARAALTLAELAQAVDGSFSVSDYLSGNEHCLPLGALPDAARSQLASIDACHTFQSHMGGVNSNHFAPQNQAMYGLYHGIALAIAKRCAALKEALDKAATHALAAAAPGETKSAFQKHVEACELEALSFEAAASHFFADAWSSGHMWERWGRPAFELDERGQVRAQVVAATSGLIHGWRALARDYTALKPFQHDKLCMPDKHIKADPLEVAVRFTQSGKGSEAAAGDLYVVQCEGEPTDRAMDANPALAYQRRRMLTCLARGFEAVYRAGPQTKGSNVFTGGTDGEITSVDAEKCFSQRVTNASMRAGLGAWRLDLTDSAVAARVVPVVAYGNGGSSTELSDLATLSINDYPRQLALIGLEMRRREGLNPEGTDVAALEGETLGQLVGVKRNSEHAGEIEAGQIEFLEPADPSRWSDRPVDDLSCRSDVDCVQRAGRDRAHPNAGTFCDHSVTVGDVQVSRCVRQEASILRAFRGAEVAYFCKSATWDDLNSARWQCAQSPLENGGKPACDACVRAVLPHLRNACEPASYVPRPAGGGDHRSTCDVLRDANVFAGNFQPLYAPYDATKPGDAERAARALCEGGAAKEQPTPVGYLDLRSGPPAMATSVHWAAGWFANDVVCGANLPKASWYRYSHAASTDAHLHSFQVDLHRYDDFPFAVPGEQMRFTVFLGAQGCAAAAAGADAGIEVAPTDADGDGVTERFKYDWLVPAGTTDEICIRSQPASPGVATGATFTSGFHVYCAQCGNCASCDKDSMGAISCRDKCAPGSCAPGVQSTFCERGRRYVTERTGCWCGTCLSRVRADDCAAGETCEVVGGTATCQLAVCTP